MSLQTVRPNLKTLLILIAAVTLYRLVMLHVASGQIDLYADEAYYWHWAQHFDFGYYSKPPMVAWLIMIGTTLFGDTFVGIKIMSLVVYIFTTLNIYFLAKELFGDEEAAFWSGAAFITLPAVWLSSLIISTDVPFLFFWSLAMLFFVKALKSDAWRHWLIVGIAGGGGLLSKYTMIIFVVSAFAYLATSPTYRRHLKNPKLYAAMALAAALYLPNLWWNAHHHFVSFVHTARDNAHVTGIHFHLNKMLEFLGSQFGVFGPVLFGWLLVLLPRYRRFQESWKLLWWFIVPMFGLILAVSLLSRAFANWSAPMYVASTVLVAVYLARFHKRWLYAALAVNVLMGVGFYHLHDITKTLGIELSRKDPYKRVLGWREMGERLSKIMARYPHAGLLMDDRKAMAEMIFYVHPHPFDALKWNPRHTLRDHYELTTDLQKHIGEDFIFVTERKAIPDVARRFEEVRPLGVIRVPLYKDFAREFHVYYLKRFKGYE
ncbi:glycosyltransferase family 39 protein [Hydrogenimonas sp.]